jgi:hypothetical protein
MRGGMSQRCFLAMEHLHASTQEHRRQPQSSPGASTHRSGPMPSCGTGPGGGWRGTRASRRRPLQHTIMPIWPEG